MPYGLKIILIVGEIRVITFHINCLRLKYLRLQRTICRTLEFDYKPVLDKETQKPVATSRLCTIASVDLPLTIVSLELLDLYKRHLKGHRPENSTCSGASTVMRVMIQMG